MLLDFRSEMSMNTSNKVLVLGDSGVGKSTFVNNLAGKYDQIPTSTIGCNVQVSFCFKIRLV
jgi:GTPase SAR1 family protein